MKYFLSIILLLAALALNAQIPHPFMLNMDGIGGDRYDATYSTTRLSDGFILSILSESTNGNINKTCSSDGRVIFKKYGANASLEWEKCYVASGDSTYGYLFPSSSNQYVLIGHKGTVTNGGRGLKAKKEDDNGNLIWSRTYGGSGDEFLRGAIATPDGGYILLAETNSDDGDVGFHYGSGFAMDIWILKINSDGDIIWSKVIGGTSDERAFGITNAPGGGCYAVGDILSNDYDGTGLHNTSHGDAYIVRLDGNGNKIWHRCIGGNKASWALAVTENGDGGALIAAQTSASDGDVTRYIGDYVTWIINIDSSNNILWDSCYGNTTGGTKPNAICRATDGTIWVAGLSHGTGGNVDAHYGDIDAWILHLGSIGEFMGSLVVGGPKSDEATVIQPLVGNMVIAGGYYEAPGLGTGQLVSYGLQDVFLINLAPWNTGVINTNKIKQGVTIHPNPCSQYVYITILETKNYKVNIVDMLGRIVHTYDGGNYTQRVDVSEWNKGVYHLNITKGDGELIMSKLTVF